MTDHATLSAASGDYATLSSPDTVQLQRLLPGPIERVWAYLTDGDLRRRWLASGAMDLRVGAPFELTWRNDELTDPPGRKPEGFGPEHRMASRITELVPLRRIAFTWNGSGDVSFDLEPQGERVLLTVTHRALASRNMMLMVGAGWHMHLDVLVARAGGRELSEPFWDGWVRLKAEYEGRLPA